MPIHKNLIELGLLELVELRRSQGEPRLFPRLERSKAKKTYTETFSKRFTRYRKDNKIYDENRDFHSFRTTFNQALVDTECLETQQHYLMGHVDNSVGVKHYTPKGFPTAKLHQRVNAVEIDISMIRRPFEKELPAKVAVPGSHLRVVDA